MNDVMPAHVREVSALNLSDKVASEIILKTIERFLTVCEINYWRWVMTGKTGVVACLTCVKLRIPRVNV